MIPKPYQTDALDLLEKFFQRCKGGLPTAAAYEETTKEWNGLALHYRPLPTLAHVPYVCLRIPTGGGKTLIGGLAIERANRSLLFTSFSVTLWLVPSEPIREQTLRALRSKDHLLHQAVFSALGEVTVLEIEEALHVRPNVLDGSNAIIVATMQAFKQEDLDRLSVYKQNSDMMPHFEGVTDPAVRGKMSLVDALRRRHPIVIVDEAHNQGTVLAFDTLARFEPSVILELTATPDRVRQPSNVLYSVGASALQAAQMIKMPLDVVRRANPQDALRDAIACLNRLQKKAEAEQASTGDYLRPIMLLQAERKDAGHDTLVPEAVRKMLIDDFEIPAEQIAIATGNVDEISGEDILSDRCRWRFIITVDKLREGWDCPFAYVLCSFRNTNSATAAEQILGRILRMPGAKQKADPDLNVAYAFITSPDFQATVESLQDGMVRNGFNRMEAKDLVHAVEEKEVADLFTPPTALTFEAPEMPKIETLPAGLSEKIEVAPELGTITIRGALTPKQTQALQDSFSTAPGKAAIREALRRFSEPAVPRVKKPSEQGELFRVPLLTLQQGDLWEPFEETHLLQGDWRLIDYSSEIGPGEFDLERKAQGGQLFVKDDVVGFRYLDNIEHELALFDYHIEWDQSRLVSWLEKNIPEESIAPDEKAAFLNRAVSALIEKRGLKIEELSYAKFRLRAALDGKVRVAKREAMRKVHQTLLLLPEQFSADGRSEMVFQHGKYVFDWRYTGFRELPKHFFPEIGNLRSEGEEFDCAAFLAAELPGVKYWVRNVERKPTAFSLQTATDRFYPDFLCLMEDGRILVVEYKDERTWDLPENIEKRQLGDLWERRSNGKGLFIMPRGKDWEAIRAKVRR